MTSTQQPFNQFKTAMCRNPKECKWGKDCGYAHTIAELRKTKMCRYVGKCTNKRCTFAHHQSELVGCGPAPKKQEPVKILKKPTKVVKVVKATKVATQTKWVNAVKQDLFDSDSESESETDTFDPALLGYDEAWKLYSKYMDDHGLDDDSWGDRSVIDTPWLDWRDDISIQIPLM